MTTVETNYKVTALKQGQIYTFKVEAVGHGVKYSKRERLSDVIPNGLLKVSGYRWSGLGPSETVQLIPGKAISEQAKLK
jgi:exo-poly-alpha-galacturonosidase